MSPTTNRALLCLLWGSALAVALATRPLLPIVEARYVSVAWEMWTRGDFLVPYLNGEPYPHKPPLLFWLIHGGWWLFGVNAWWPRLVCPLVGLLCLGQTALLARRLWPDQPEIARSAPWLLFGTLFFTFFYTLVQFDLLVTACTLLGLLGLLQAAQGQHRGFAFFGLAIGLGVLAKGPVILLHLFPAALLAPLWTSSGRSPRWFLGLFLALLGGAVIALAWAIPAAYSGGEAYREAIFWKQTAGRVVNSFAHRHPWWWYLPMLPLLLAPWVGWPSLWKRPEASGLRHLFKPGRVVCFEKRREHLPEASHRYPLAFLTTWLAPVFVGFSLVSGKQLKYLLPLLPGAILLFAATLDSRKQLITDSRAPAYYIGVTGLFFTLLPLAAPHLGLPRLATLPVWPGALLILASMIGLRFWRPVALAPTIRGMTAASALIIVLAHLGPIRALAPTYDVTEVAANIGRFQKAGVIVAHAGKYHGQFHFPGRLRRPLVVIPVSSIKTWANQHPKAVIVVYRNRFSPPLPTEGALGAWDYRGRSQNLMLWRASDLAKVLTNKR
ncbi:MAG: hypothetical protein AXA67_06755 [Methylothermaceae bacteria B42]|nr:MAG: hypothetical protein AXA67_06755 [Methylothermaceae bacteria B42]HHJ40275.1 glycosyltransferase family 39 protein [Methylothermaceae bacterium]